MVDGRSTEEHPHALVEIARRLDARWDAFLHDPISTRFWFASCSMPGGTEAAHRRWHAAGYANYPLRPSPLARLFFFEYLAGCELGGPQASGSPFDIWCPPLISHPREIDRVPVSVCGLPRWEACEGTLAGDALPIAAPAFTPLDWACSLCGAERFFLLLADDAPAAEALLTRLTALFRSVLARLDALGIASRAPFGFRGIYANDLQMPCLSPAQVARFLLPVYARAGGPLVFSLNCADPGVLREALALDNVLGCAFDKRLPLPLIAEHLGRKLFLIAHYVYLPRFDRPTLHDGIYCNPIVQSHSEDIEDVCRVFSAHSLLILLERHRFALVQALRRRLERIFAGPAGG